MKTTRRSFFAATGLSAAAFALGTTLPTVTGLASEQSKSGNVLFTLGVCSYTFRAFDNDKIIEWMKQGRLKYLSLKDFHLAMKSTEEECAALAKKYEDAGLKIYSCGVVYMKNEADVENAFRYAKALGCSSIVGVPNHELLPLVNEKVKATGIAVGIHNHGPGDKLYPSAESIFEKIVDLDPRIGLTMDIGHSIRIGEDPVQAIHKYASRLLDFHFKDVTQADAKGTCAVCGFGIIDLPAVVKALVDVQYKGIASFEYEIDKDDPMPGLMQSVGYIRGLCAIA